MAIAAPRVKLLRQLAKAKDDYMSGAFDIAWDGGFATIFMVFGQPSHAVFESGGTRLDGEPALDALLRELPVQFAVSDWRRAMSPGDTLAVTIDDITEPLAELVGERAEVHDESDGTSWLGSHDDSPDLGFDLESFPLLPRGAPLWDEAPAETVALADRLAAIDTALIVLTGPRLRAAGVVRDGDLIDAVWVDSADHARGETAGMALLGARDGTVAGYALDNSDVAEALPMLWRLPRGDAIDGAWVDPSALIGSLLDDNDEHVLLIEGSERAAGFFTGGAVVAAYTASSPVPVRSTDVLLDAMSRPSTTLRVLQRHAPRPARSSTTVAAAPRAATMPLPAEPVMDAAPPRSDTTGKTPVPSDAAPAPMSFEAIDAPSTPHGSDVVESDAAPSGYRIVEKLPVSTGYNIIERAPASNGADAIEPPPAPASSTIKSAWSTRGDEIAPEDTSAATMGETVTPGTTSWVDFDDVRRELAAIAVAWLGDDAAPVTECVLATPSVVEDFVTTLDTVRHMSLPGHDNASIYAMAREMHVHAAERLCGA